MKTSQDDQRLAVAEAGKQQAWQLAIAEQDSIENIVIVLAHERDNNAGVLLKALGIAANTPGADDWTMVVIRRVQAIRALEPFEPELATLLGSSVGSPRVCSSVLKRVPRKTSTSSRSVNRHAMTCSRISAGWACGWRARAVGGALFVRERAP